MERRRFFYGNSFGLHCEETWTVGPCDFSDHDTYLKFTMEHGRSHSFWSSPHDWDWVSLATSREIDEVVSGHEAGAFRREHDPIRATLVAMTCAVALLKSTVWLLWLFRYTFVIVALGIAAMYLAGVGR